MNIKNTFLALLASIFLVSCSTQGPKGEQGLQGEAGNGIVSIIKTNNEGLIDTYTITYTDGTTSTFTVTNGQNGNQGIQGEPGKDGHTPVITIGDNGNWFIDGVDSGFKAFNEVKTFVVTFHLNGGVLPEGYNEMLTVNQGDTLDLPIPLKDGYVFTGWYTGETINDKQFSNSDGVFKDLDLYATYEIAKDIIVKNGVTYILNYDTLEAYIKRYDGFNFTDGDIVEIPEHISYGSFLFQVTKILDSAFYRDYSLIKEIRLPNTLLSIDSNAFHMQEKLKNINLPVSLESIGSAAFDRCLSLESIYIPANTSKIDNNAFSGCLNLKEIAVSSENEVYDSRNNCNALVETATNKLVMGTENSVIPDTITCIGSYAFSGMSNFPKIPSSVIEIGESCFSGNTGFVEELDLSSVSKLGSNAFSGCQNLHNIIFGNNLDLIPYGCFEKCVSIENVVLPDTILTIEASAFNECTSLVSVKLPKKLEIINNGTFYLCESLTTVYIGPLVKRIDYYAFGEGCKALTDIYYSGTPEEWSNIFIDQSNKLDNANFHFNYNY